ncbi:type II CAAX prenyl endopeptidase Rce1 family protein [Novosphingobium sp. AAP83]|uniref:CPBP family glutamic-type intramembrane protease n=1 Tax=Novosphingobium sp. AAP83 TaxID=1523425 RepID=UPI000A63A3D9|nr:CPBP family glutamic-type intramembrane protease [Novosphingobium sp. AAP83]
MPLADDALSGNDCAMILPTTVFATLMEPIAFWRNPQPMRPDGLRAAGAWRRWALLTAMQVGGLMGVVVPVMLAWRQIFDLPSPDAFNGMTPLALWGGTVLLAPVLEELFFRGWLSGLPRALWAMAITLAGLALFMGFGKANPLAGGGILLATTAAVIGVWFWLRHKQERPGWFDGAFPWLFHINALAFAALHLANYPKFTLAAIPLVLPQFWTGLMLGFLRLRIGLGAAILTHIISNAIALTLAMIVG